MIVLFSILKKIDFKVIVDKMILDDIWRDVVGDGSLKVMIF